MNVRGLAIALVVLIGLGGALFWSQHHPPAADTSASSATVMPTILTVDPAKVSEIAIRQKEQVVLKQVAADRWEIRQPKAYPADSQAVATLLSTLSGLRADRVIEEKATDRKQYGLDPASLELVITSKDGKEQRLRLGDDTPAGSDCFATLAGDPRVFTVASYYKSSLGKGVEDLREKKPDANKR